MIKPFFWLKLFGILAFIVLLFYLYNILMSKLLNVKRRKMFAYDHLNEKHRFIDWMIRWTSVAALIIGYIINTMRDPLERFWFLETYVILFVFIIVTETTRAFMEWRYAENRNASIFTISQLVFAIILLTILFLTDFFGWFD